GTGARRLLGAAGAGWRSQGVRPRRPLNRPFPGRMIIVEMKKEGTPASFRLLQRLIDYGIATGYLRGRTVQRTSRRAALHPERARSRRALRPRSMIPRGGRGHGFHVDAAFVMQ